MLSLETCKKLRDAGWLQERTPYYRIFLAAENIDCADDHWDKGSPTTACFLASIPDNLNFVACPTLEELLEAVRVVLLDTSGYVTLSDGGNCWTVSIDYMSDNVIALRQSNFSDSDPSEAVAALWLRLKGYE